MARIVTVAAAGDYGKAGTHLSVADIVDAGSLEKVRSYKKQMKAAQGQERSDRGQGPAKPAKPAKGAKPAKK